MPNIKFKCREQSIALSPSWPNISPSGVAVHFHRRAGCHTGNSKKEARCIFFRHKGFTDLSEEMEPESLTEILNSYFTEMSQIALKYGGTIDKFVGDSIMVFFGDPSSRGAKQDTLACVAMAIEMRKHMKI